MFEKYVALIQEAGEITPQLLRAIINDHKTKKQWMQALYERYKASIAGVPIYTRILPAEANKINNKLANDWFSEIVDTKTGYLFGIPVAVALDKSAAAYDDTAKRIETFRKMNSFDDLNGEMGKFSAMAGYDTMLAYIDPEGMERVMRVDPWEACIISQTEISEPQYGVRYYQKDARTLRVEFFDDTNREIWEGGIGSLRMIERKPHLFDYCPLIGVPNNAELMGDGERVLSLIDAYDRSMSDFNSEIEQFRLAYLMFVGYEPDEEELEKMRQTGALYIPDSTEGQKIEFLTKQIAHEAIDSHLDRLEANIIRFAKHVNFTDAAFGGDITGPAMRFKLFMLETKAKMMERKHEAAMLFLFKVIGSAWKKRGLPKFDYTQLDFKYTRNIPVNLLDAAQTMTQMWGKTSKRTALSVMPNITDVDEELRNIEDEAGEAVNLDDPDLIEDSTGATGTPGVTGGTNGQAGATAATGAAATS